MNNIFVSWKQKIESRIISDLKSQYTESEEQIRQRKEQFLKKQKKIILIEIIAGAVFLAFLIIRAAFLQDDILLSRNSFGQGSKEVQLSLKKDDKKKEITYKLDEQKLSAEEESKVYEVEYLISGKNSDIDNLKRVANYILLLRFINNYIFTGKDTQMKTHINTMASAITGVMGMPQTMKAVQVLIRMAISYGESLLELHTLFSGGEVPLIKDKTTWNLTLKTMAEQLRNKQIVKKGKKNISYKDYLKLFLLTKGNSRTVCYRMMDIMQENIASKEPGFLMENCLFSYSWKGSLAAGGVKLNFVKQCSY